MSWIRESSRTGALEAFLKGQKVLVLMELDDGSVVTQRLEELLPEDARYLVDAVPAVENPEFKQAVEEMMEQELENSIEPEESIAPPRYVGGDGDESKKEINHSARERE